MLINFEARACPKTKSEFLSAIKDRYPSCKIIKHQWIKNNLWMVEEDSIGERIIFLYRFYPGKNEFAIFGPSKSMPHSCPLSLIKYLADNKIRQVEAWIQGVMAYHENAKIKLYDGYIFFAKLKSGGVKRLTVVSTMPILGRDEAGTLYVVKKSAIVSVPGIFERRED